MKKIHYITMEKQCCLRQKTVRVVFREYYLNYEENIGHTLTPKECLDMNREECIKLGCKLLPRGKHVPFDVG